MQLGSHRIKQSWIEHRYEWLLPNGKPQSPQWTKTVKSLGAIEIQQAKSELVEFRGELSKHELLKMMIPQAQRSKDKGTKAEKDALEVRKSFRHVADKVRKREVKQASTIINFELI